MPAFETQYAVIQRCVRMPAIDEIATIDAAACSHHRAPACFMREHRAGEVRVEDVVPLLARRVEQRAEGAGARGGDASVQRAVRVGRDLHGGDDVVLVRDVAGGDAHFGAGRASSVAFASSSLFWRRPMSVTTAPSLRSCVAQARPMPVAPPVMRTCWSASGWSAWLSPTC